MLLILALSGLLAGCGGNGHEPKAAAKGRLNFTVTWPEAARARSAGGSRAIPVSAQSLVVEIKQGGVVFTSGLIARPASTLSFAELPTGPMSVVATAYASTDGTGTPLATASVPTTIVANTTASVDVTLNSTIDHLEVTPNPYTLGALLSGTLSVVGRDANNNVVLIDPTSLSFASSNPSVVSVTSSGIATAGLSVGSATITITESDSGKTLALPVSVLASVSLTPSAPTINVRAATTFVATVVGPANTAVTYSVQEGAAGGTITAGGVYTAPTTRGTYHVVATSVADPSRKAVATVTVTSGSLNVGVH